MLDTTLAFLRSSSAFVAAAMLVFTALTPSSPPALAQAPSADAARAEAIQSFNTGLDVYHADDHVTARPLFKHACDSGIAQGCGTLAIMLANAQGGPADLPEARNLFQRACDSGDYHACINLGVMQRNGRGGPVAMDKARATFQRSCDGGEMSGCFNLAVLLEKGQGGPTDAPAARELFKRVCQAGYPQACPRMIP